MLFADLSGFKYMSGNILDAVRDFLRNNTDGAGCNPRIQSYMTGMPSHDFHYAASFMRFAGIIQFIYTFNNRVVATQMGHRAVELLEQGIGDRVIAQRSDCIVDLDLEEALAMKKDLDRNLYHIMLDTSF